MNPKVSQFLVRLYPPSWRARYGSEFQRFLEAGPSGFRTIANVAWSALCEHILPTSAPAHLQSVSAIHFQWWCTTAPWAIFGLAPVFVLAAAYVLALVLLWSGWNLFLPAADTPFGHPVDGLANIYFQADKFFYFAAPVFVGWVLSLVTARQRVKAVWPSLGFILIALSAATNQVHASRTTVPGGFGHISLDFSLGTLGDNLAFGFTVLALAALPYFVWYLRKARYFFA